MILAVLDTNVVVSSLLNPSGLPGRIVESWERGLFQLGISKELFLEIADVLDRPAIRKKTRMSDSEIPRLLELLVETSVVVSGNLEIESIISNDPDDDVILATAVATGADIIVSGDRHLLELEIYRGIPIVSPRQFAEILGH
jgi:putative PIN family toxin of toxin-antitoxin system